MTAQGLPVIIVTSIPASSQGTVPVLQTLLVEPVTDPQPTMICSPSIRSLAAPPIS
ncbi:MAG: hypothetical protein ACLTTU_13535 [Bilophila wadsworthia]